MAPPILCGNIFDAGAIELIRYISATPSPSGSAFSTQATTFHPNAQDRFIQFLGEIYCAASDGLYQKDDPTTLAGTWTQILAFTNVAAGGNRITGVHLVYISDVPHLTGCYGDAAGTTSWRGYTWDLFNASGAVTGAIVTGVGSESNDEVVYRNQLFFHCDTSGFYHVWDPNTSSFATITIQPFGSTCPALTVLNDRLVGIARGINTNEARQYILDGGAFVAWGTTPGFSIATVTFTDHKWGAFTDGDNVYWFLLDANGINGMVCMEVDSAGNRTDITNTVVPLALRSPTRPGGTFAGTSTSTISRFLVDNNTNPLVPAIYLYFSPILTTGGPWSVYVWNGNAALMTLDDTGGNIAHAMPFNGQAGGGQRIWTPGELDCAIMGRANALGGEQLTVRASGDVGPTDKTLSVYFNKKGESDLTKAFLTGPVTGGSAALNGGNDGIDNVEANVAVTYTFVVDFDASGISAGERVQYYLDVA